jgi:hypothetical protein
MEHAPLLKTLGLPRDDDRDGRGEFRTAPAVMDAKDKLQREAL